MKILLVLFLVLSSCSSKRDLEPLENALYESEIIYVEMDKSELHEILDVSESDYSDCILLKSLLVYQPSYVYIFHDPSMHLKNQLKNYAQDAYYEEMDSFVFYVNEKNMELIGMIHKYLYEIIK